MAKTFLDSRRDNQRNVQDRHVKELASAILEGRWLYNGESIKFDVSGHMIDGQHRCIAGIKAGKSFVSDIVYGLPENSYYTIDQKIKRRSVSDILKMNGESNTNVLAAALSWHIMYREKNISRAGKRGVISPDSQQIWTELNHHPGMRKSVLFGVRCRHLTGPGPLTFLHYLFWQIDQELADKFFTQMASGEGIYQSNPVYHIRKMLYDDRIKNKAKLPIGEKLASIIKGWNIGRNGKQASRQGISWKSTGERKESFPEAR